MTKQEVQMTFNGVTMAKYFRVEDVRRPIMAERDISTDDAPNLGVNVQRVKRGAKEIEVDIVMKQSSGLDMERVKTELAGVLDVIEAVRVTFSDEPDKYYMAMPSEHIDPDNIASWFQKGTLTLLVPDGVAHSTTYKRVADALDKGDHLLFIIQNNGNHPAKPIIKVKHTAENGYIGVVNTTGALEFGNVEEADTETVKRSEVLMDYRDAKITQGLSAARQKVAILNDRTHQLVGTVASVNVWGRPHLHLSSRGATTGAPAGSLTWDLPADSTGAETSLNDYIWWRQIFWLGAANQYGFIKLTVSDEQGQFLYGVETIKRANGLGVEYNLLGGDGKGGYNILRQFTFTGTHLDKDNPFNEPRGWSDIRRVDEKVTFHWWGSYIPFHIPQIKGRKSKQLHVAFGSYGTKPLVTHMYLDSIMYQRDNVPHRRDIPNAFAIGSTVELNTENDTALLNGLSAADRVVHGSQWLTIPKGESTLEVYPSSWCKTKPEVTINFEELY